MDLASSAISVEKRVAERFAVRHEVVADILMVIRAWVAKRRRERGAEIRDQGSGIREQRTVNSEQ